MTSQKMPHIQNLFVPQHKEIQMKEKIKRNIKMQVYLSSDEFEQICLSAKRANLSISTFGRRICLGSPVQSREDARARLELLKINADLGRLGGLLKLGITEKIDIYKMRAILKEIEERQKEIQQKIMEI